MKKLIILIIVTLSVSVSAPVYGQGFFDKINKGLDKVNKGLEKVNKELDKVIGSNSSIAETENNNPSDAYKGVMVKSFSPKIDISLISCIRDGSRVTVEYYLTNNGSDITISNFGTSKTIINPNDETLVIDSQSKRYEITYNKLGDMLSTDLLMSLPSGIRQKGVFEISGISPNVKQFKLLNMAGLIPLGSSRFEPFSFSFKNVPIYTLDEILSMMQPTVIASVDDPLVSKTVWEGTQIKSVVVTDKYTRVDCTWINTKYSPNGYIFMDNEDNCRIEIGNKKYMLIYYAGMGRRQDDVLVKYNQTANFTYVFEPIPADSPTFNLIGDGFDFLDVKLAKEISVAVLETDLKKANLKGRVNSIVEKEGLKQVNTYKYNENGMLLSTDYKDLTKSAYPRSGSITCTYNDRNLLLTKIVKIAANGQVNYLNKGVDVSQNCTYSYDQNGRLVKCYDSQDKSTTVYEYNGKGQLVKEIKTATGSEPYILLYVYDGRGNMTAIHSDKISEYPIEAFKYDSKNRVIEEMSGGQSFELNYNDRGDLVSRIYEDFEGIPQFDSFEYTYDAQGNWTKKVWKNTKGLVVSTETRTILYY